MTRIVDIAFVRYQAPDLESMETFLVDFGLQRAARTADALYMRAAGTAHHCHITEKGDTVATVGFGLRAASAADLQALSAKSGRPIEANPEPGGGQRVRLVDPAGFVVDVIHGQATLEALPVREPSPMNGVTGRQRFGRTIRLKPQPSTVARLGHVALLVADFHACFSFYSDMLGFKPSDTYWAGVEDNKIAAFMHFGLGDEWTDHHTLALITAQDGKSRFDHSAFEVVDLDDVVHGGQWLKDKGYKHAWGVGRHVQGSQIFDYWRDPFGNKIEHWTDGDLVNDSTPVGTAEISNDALHQWSPPLNPEFYT
jgi:catechol 2,3-dioxygenase-like lactoylglutathione lyase family enzyme